MEITGLTVAQHADYLALINAEIRPQDAATRPWDDFPLALDPANLPWMLAARDEDGALIGGLAILVRHFTTSCGTIAIGAVGSVVTRPDCRGRGVSAALQGAAVDLLARQGVPLAVLWTDRPEIYAGRGFVPSGVERHGDLAGASLPVQPPAGVRVRAYVAADASAVAGLYEKHPWHTVRLPGEAARLYGMAGTKGLVAEAGGIVRAAVFCGKGADFPAHVPEWSGDPELVLILLGIAHGAGQVSAAMLPLGAEELAGRLESAGASLIAVPSGCWAVTRPDRLTALAMAAGVTPPTAVHDPRAWLGVVDDAGAITAGPLAVAVWGFDSI